MEFEGFVGGAYEAANARQDIQRLINWYVEFDSNDGAKTPKGLLGVPGLVSFNSAYTGEVRGAWTLPGGVSAVFVIGNVVVLATVSTLGTNAAFPVFSFAQIGNVNSNAGQVKMRDNGAGNILAIVDGLTLYIYNISSGGFNASFDPAFLGSSVVLEMDGIFFFSKPNSQKFFCTPPYWNGIAPLDGTYYALKDNNADNIVTMLEANRQMWIIGESTTEIWYNAGNPTFPLSRLQGALLQIGCAATQTVVRTGEALIWLANSERGGKGVVMTQGYTYSTISTPAITYQINQYPVFNDAFAYIYSEEGHEFYVLVFPTADLTWVYDLTTELWHQRASKDMAGGQFHRQRANCCAMVSGMHLVGDYANGNIYWQTRQVFVDGPTPLVCQRRAPHTWDKKSRHRVNHARLQIEFETGIGQEVGQGVNPSAMLRWSNDGGLLWSNENWRNVGVVGDTLARVIWRRLGAARDRVYELNFSDPVPRDIVGASLDVMESNA